MTIQAKDLEGVPFVVQDLSDADTYCVLLDDSRFIPIRYYEKGTIVWDGEVGCILGYCDGRPNDGKPVKRILNLAAITHGPAA